MVKGIDDAMAAGAPIQVLTGDDARAAVAATPRRPGEPLTPGEVLGLARSLADADAIEAAARVRADLVPSLATLDPLATDAIIERVCEVLPSIRRQTLAREVREARKAVQPPALEAPGSSELFPHVPPWPGAVPLVEVLADAAAYLRRFVVLPEHAAETLALWSAMTWTFEAFERLPLLALTSPAPRSGKSTALELLGRIVARPLPAVSVSAAVLYRVVARHRPTVLLDEADSLLADNEDLTAIVNAAHAKATARVVRCHPDTLEPEVFPCFAPIALAGNNPKMAPATRDRTIAVKMVRKGPGERCEKARAVAVDPVALPIARKLARLAQDLPAMLAETPCPPLPDCLNDRAADSWEPLFRLAAVAGGRWPEAVQAAAITSAGADDDAETLGIRLLADLKAAFEVEGMDRLPTDRIIERLTADREGPWGEEPRLTPRRLARLLRPFGVASKNIRLPSGQTPKGYLLEDLAPVFERYLPAPPPQNPPHPPQVSPDAGKRDLPIRHNAHSVADSVPAIPESYQGCGGCGASDPPRRRNFLFPLPRSPLSASPIRPWTRNPEPPGWRCCYDPRRPRCNPPRTRRRPAGRRRKAEGLRSAGGPDARGSGRPASPPGRDPGLPDPGGGGRPGSVPSLWPSRLAGPRCWSDAGRGPGLWRLSSPGRGRPFDGLCCLMEVHRDRT